MKINVVPVNGVVKEGQYAYFDVALVDAAVASRRLTLTLGNQADGARAGTDYSQTLEVSTDGVTWTRYDGTLPLSDSARAIHVRVLTLADATRESAETMTLSASLTAGNVMANSAGSVTIDDVVPATTISVSGTSVVEGSFGYSTMTFTVTRAGDLRGASTVRYATADVSATAGSDYEAASGTLAFAPGEASKTVTVRVFGDLGYEPDETLTLNLSGATGAVLSVNGAGGRIVNDDALQATTLAVDDVSVREGNGGATTMLFTVTRSGNLANASTVDFSTVDVTAIAGSDYVARSGTLSFAPGESSKTVAVQVLGDWAVEGNEGLSLNLTRATGATIADGKGLGMIVNDDTTSPLAPTISVNDVSISEGGPSPRTMTFTLARAGDLKGYSSVEFSTSDGTATAGMDYYAKRGSLLFAPGESTKTVTIEVNTDPFHEDDESLYLNLTAPVNARIVDAQGMGTIVDDDRRPPPQFMAVDARVDEGNDGYRTLSFKIARTGDLSKAGTVDYVTADGSAAAGSDYVAQRGTLSFAAGESAKVVTVSVAGDKAVEGDETLYLNLSNATGGQISRAQASGTIANDDVAPPPAITVSDTSVTEGTGGTSTLTFTVSRSGDLSRPSFVRYDTADDTARAGSDYKAASGTLIFAPGESTQTVAVEVTGDAVAEGKEALFLKLSDAFGATIVDAEGFGSIVDDDAPAISIDDITVMELYFDGKDGANAAGTSNYGSFTVSLSVPAKVPVTVNFATASGSAVAGGSPQGGSADYVAASGSVTFNPGETSKRVTVAVLADSQSESEESFYVNLSGATNATISDAQGVCVIPKNSSPLVLDLDGDGIASIASSEGVYFDNESLGVTHRMGWVGGGDGLLARDLNGDGRINDGSELFGQGTSDGAGGRMRDGFQALAALDGDQDGDVDADDAGFGELRVWRDSDRDAVTDEGELVPLSSLGITRLNLAHTVSDRVENGNLHGLVGSYETADGETRELTDVFFGVDEGEATELLPMVGLDGLKALGDADGQGRVWHVDAGAGDVLIRGFDAAHDVLDLRDLFPGDGDDAIDFGGLKAHSVGKNTVLEVRDTSGAVHNVVMAGLDSSGHEAELLADLLKREQVVVD